MPKSSQVAHVDEVQAAIAARLKPEGFRVRGRTFNRTTADGLIQVINLQMGAFDPPGTIRILGLRPSLYGWFTVNLGVYVAEVARLNGGGEAKVWYEKCDCCLRARLGEFGPEPSDLWWRNDAVEETIPDIEKRLDDNGLPFLARFASRDAILWELHGEVWHPGGSSPARIVIAIILAERGKLADAKELLAAQAVEAGNPLHAAHVRSLASKLGMVL